MIEFIAILGSTLNRAVPLISQAFSEPYELCQKNYMEIDEDWMGKVELGMTVVLAY